MDTVFGIRYKGGVILATDQTNARSILLYQNNLDKIIPLSSHSALALSGPNSDLVRFSDYVQKNIAYYELTNHGMKMSTAAQANFCRSELATALRKGPYQVNVMLGGYDSKSSTPSLYWLDYLASCQKVDYGAQGYAAAFCLSIMDKDWKEDLSYDEAVGIVDKCIGELQTRFLIAQSNFMVKCVDSEGVRVVKFGADPADT